MRKTSIEEAQAAVAARTNQEDAASQPLFFTDVTGEATLDDAEALSGV
jgi:hypothetical protein